MRARAGVNTSLVHPGPLHMISLHITKIALWMTCINTTGCSHEGRFAVHFRYIFAYVPHLRDLEAFGAFDQSLIGYICHVIISSFGLSTAVIGARDHVNQTRIHFPAIASIRARSSISTGLL